MGELSELAAKAVAAAEMRDRAAFAASLAELENRGWDEEQIDIAAEFLLQVELLIGDEPAVNSVVILAQAVTPLVKEFMNVSVQDVELLIRAYVGSDETAGMFPRNFALMMQLGLIGALPQVGALDLSRLVRDSC